MYTTADLSLFLITGCDSTVYRLLYNSLDTIIYSSATRYVKPSSAGTLPQEKSICTCSGTADQLAKYIVTLRGIRERMAAGIKKSDIAWIQARFERTARSCITGSRTMSLPFSLLSTGTRSTRWS